MERYYGVIKNRSSALRFATALKAATTTDAGSPIKTVSDVLQDLTEDDPLYKYTWLPTFLSVIKTVGYADQATSEAMAGRVLKSLTIDKISNYDSLIDPEQDIVLALGENTYIVVHPRDTSLSPVVNNNFQYMTRIRIVQKVSKTVESTVTDPETGEETTTTTTTTRANSVDLYQLNHNLASDCIAYEITKTYSGDALVKIATCPDSVPDYENYLQPIFTQLRIQNYEAWIDNAGYDAARVVINQGHAVEYQNVFGIRGEFGGFLVHQMKTKVTDSSIYGEMEPGSSTFGLTLFWHDGTPMYTWSDSSEPWDSLNEAKTAWTAINNPIGRTLNGTLRDPTNPKSAPVIKMGALAPIMCPSMKDTARYAKWLFQSPHDYSYFDKSGHLYLKGANSNSDAEYSNDNVFFMDYGVALWDGPLSNFSLSDKSIPDINPENQGLYTRPVVDDPMPYSTGMWAYFDCLAGLDGNGWMNCNGENDFIFTNGPVINADGSAHFANRYSNPITGMVLNGKWAGAASHHVGSIYYAVCKWHVDNVRSDWTAFIFGLLFDSRTRKGRSINNAAMFAWGRNNQWVESDLWDNPADDLRMRHSPIPPDTWIIVVRYTCRNGYDVLAIYDMQGNFIDSWQLYYAYRYDFSLESDWPTIDVDAAICICGDPVGIWYKDDYTNPTIVQGKKQYPPWDAQFPNVNEEVTLDLKFFAAGLFDGDGVLGFDQTINWEPFYHRGNITAGVKYLARRFGTLKDE